MPAMVRNKRSAKGGRHMKTLFESHVQLVGKVMDLRLKRQNVVMSNLANISTPNYRPRLMEFEGQLQAALDLDARGKISRTSEEHIPSVFNSDNFDGEWEKEFQPHVVHGDDSVDLDKEMAAMSKNQLMYNALTTVLHKNFEGLKTVIQEGQK